MPFLIMMLSEGAWGEDDESAFRIIAARPEGGATPQGVRWWVKFCAEKGTSVYLADFSGEGRTWEMAQKEEWTLVKFAVWLRRKRGIQAPSIESYVSDVKSLFTKGGAVRVGTFQGEQSDKRWKELIKSYRGANRPQTTLREAMTTSMIFQAQSVLFNMDDPGMMTQMAALHTAVQAVMRGGELGVSKRGKIDSWSGVMGMHRGDVHWSGMFHPTQPHLKLNMFPLKKRSPKKATVILPWQDHPSNAAWLINKLFQVDPVPDGQPEEETPLFRNPQNNQPYCTEDWGMLVKMIARTLGLDDSNFGAHSLRIAGATLLYEAGFSLESIKLMGRWDTDIAEVYLRLRQGADLLSMGTAFQVAT